MLHVYASSCLGEPSMSVAQTCALTCCLVLDCLIAHNIQLHNKTMQSHASLGNGLTHQPGMLVRQALATMLRARQALVSMLPQQLSEQGTHGKHAAPQAGPPFCSCRAAASSNIFVTLSLLPSPSL